MLFHDYGNLPNREEPWDPSVIGKNERDLPIARQSKTILTAFYVKFLHFISTQDVQHSLLSWLLKSEQMATRMLSKNKSVIK